MHLFFRFYYLNLPLTRLYGTIKKCIITQLLFFFFIQVGAWLSSQSVKKDLCNADKWEQLCQSWVRSYPLFSSSSQKGWLWLHNTADILYICMIASALKSNTLASKKKYVEFFRSVLDPVFFPPNPDLDQPFFLSPDPDRPIIRIRFGKIQIRLDPWKKCSKTEV